MFKKTYKNGVTVFVEAHVVSAEDRKGKPITSSDVAYYYAEWGYDLETEEQVADQFYTNFCSPQASAELRAVRDAGARLRSTRSQKGQKGA